MQVDATATLAYLDRVRAQTGERVTITPVDGAALGRAIRQVPEIRARVVLGRLIALDACDIARPVLVLVATADHRVVDGAHAGQLAGIVSDLVLHPERLDDIA